MHAAASHLNGFECPVKSKIKDPAVNLAQSTKGEEKKGNFYPSFHLTARGVIRQFCYDLVEIYFMQFYKIINFLQC